MSSLCWLSSAVQWQSSAIVFDLMASIGPAFNGSCSLDCLSAIRFVISFAEVDSDSEPVQNVNDKCHEFEERSVAV